MTTTEDEKKPTETVTEEKLPCASNTRATSNDNHEDEGNNFSLRINAHGHKFVSYQVKWWEECPA